MACLEMYNSEHKGAPMSPRISFSNDFVESHSQITNSNTSNTTRSLREMPPRVSTDFEFSVSNNSLQLSAADELFFKGRILPFKDTHQFQKPPVVTTLRDELLNGDDDDDEDQDHDFFALKNPNKGRWKGFLGLRKSHIASKKIEANTLRSLNEPSNGFFSFPLQDPQGILREEEEATGAADMEVKL